MSTQIAIDTLSRLTKVTGEEGDYLHMQISFSDDNRAYICSCPMIQDHFVIHMEYDSKLDNTRVLNAGGTSRWLSSIGDEITYVGLRESPDEDSGLTTLYAK